MSRFSLEAVRARHPVWIAAAAVDALDRRRARRDPDSPLVFHRDGIPIRRWRTAWRTACPSRIHCQAATGSWTKARQWETERTLFSSARATMCPPAKVNGVWPFNDAWLRTSLEEARRQAPRNGASILDAARELGIRDAQGPRPR